ncbi:MAG: tetratricopeptide repeat protein [Candidatus Neomarinimicrobiota bacterium]
MRLLRLLLPVLLLTSLLFGKPDAELDRLFQEGNAAYQAENYTESIRLYEEALTRGYACGPLYFNLGNAYYRTGSVGRAILNYERAVRQMPNDPNVTFNLRLANLSVKDKIDVPPPFFLLRWNERLVNLWDARGWAGLFSVLLLLAVTGFAVLLNFDLGRLRPVLKSASLALGLLSLLVILLFGQKYRIETAADQGIIISSAVSSLAAPQAASTELFIVHEGTKVKILDVDEDWLKIELVDGKQGWVPASDIVKI